MDHFVANEIDHSAPEATSVFLKKLLNAKASFEISSRKIKALSK